MEIVHYLAMTAAEFGCVSHLPPKLAWMACHFSPYALGLSNLPRALPPDALLIVDDITPIRGHNPRTIADQLQTCVQTFSCRGVLLDFQRPENPETAALAEYLAGALSCPVGISRLYAGSLPCPVFLPPVPVQTPVKDYLAPWQGRQIWLDTAPDAARIILTEQGAAIQAERPGAADPSDFRDETLHCRYRIGLSEDRAEFFLYRSPEDLSPLLSDAAQYGVTAAVGLYQEWKHALKDISAPENRKAE